MGECQGQAVDSWALDGEMDKRALAQKFTDLLAGVGGDGQAIGKEPGHLVFFDHLHRHYGNDHLMSGEAGFFQDSPPRTQSPRFPLRAPAIHGSEPSMSTMDKSGPQGRVFELPTSSCGLPSSYLPPQGSTLHSRLLLHHLGGTGGYPSESHTPVRVP